MSVYNYYDNILLALYFLLWVFAFFNYNKLKRKLNPYSVFVILNCLYALCSWILFNLPEYTFKEIQIFPFVFLFSMHMVISSPIRRFSSQKIINIEKPNIKFLNIISIFIIAATILQIPSVLEGLSSSLLRLFLDSSGGQDLYNEAMAESVNLGDGSIRNLPSIITNAFGYVSIFLLFYYLTLPTSSKFIVVGLLSSILLSLFNNIILGQRGPIIELLLSALVTYYFFDSQYSKARKKIFKMLGVLLLLIFLTPVVILTISRFGSSTSTVWPSLMYYMGQQNLYFNNYGLDNDGLRNGDRVLPFFKKILGYHDVPNNFWERRDKYPDLLINDEVFIGHIGDLTLDFGGIGGLMMVLVLFFLYSTLINFRNGIVKFHDLLLLHALAIIIVVGSLKLFPFSDVAGNLQLIVYFLLYIIFKSGKFAKKISHNF